MMFWGMGAGWGYAFMAISMLVFWALVVGAIVLLVRSTSATRRDGPDPRQILAERFARGEIDETEYRTRLQALRSRGAHPIQ